MISGITHGRFVGGTVMDRWEHRALLSLFQQRGAARPLLASERERGPDADPRSKLEVSKQFAMLHAAPLGDDNGRSPITSHPKPITHFQGSCLDADRPQFLPSFPPA